MKLFTKIFCLTIVSLLLTACAQPNFINHPEPKLIVPYKDFYSAYCPSGDICSPEIISFGCDELKSPSNLLGGLSPSYSLAECIYYPYRDETGPTQDELDMIENGEYISNLGGLLQSYTRYVISIDGRYKLIKTKSEFRSIYIPIENPEEALSYSLVMTDLVARYGITYEPEYKYKVETLEDTHVETLLDGFVVHLFSEYIFGCGPHWIYAIDIHVGFDGQITQIKSQQIYKNPADDELCVD